MGGVPAAGGVARGGGGVSGGGGGGGEGARGGGGARRSEATRGVAHFDRLYAASADPWGFRDSAYERAKYAATLRALGERRFGAALEVGCSIGELTRLLAGRCETVLGVDFSAAALATAEAGCAGLAGVSFRRAAVPGEWPEGRFELIVLSEVLYFFHAADLARVAARVAGGLAPGGVAVLVNWVGPTDDPLSGDEAAELFLAEVAGRLRVVRQARAVGYRLDVVEAGPGRAGASGGAGVGADPAVPKELPPG